MGLDLSKFERKRYTQGKTPIEYLANLTEIIGGPEIYLKHDDLLGLAGGGNKTRKLEFLVADAQSRGADTLITCGALQSNHCRLTLAAARKEGMHAVLVLSEIVSGSYKKDAGGNNYLYRLMSPLDILVVPGTCDLNIAMQERAETLRNEGYKPYIIPMGGSNALGCLGYIACAEEIVEQSSDLGIEFSHVITPTGSCGTHTGLLMGFRGLRTKTQVIGISVNNPRDNHIRRIAQLAQKVNNELFPKRNILIENDDIIVFDDYIGPGYSLPTEGLKEAVQLLARREAILLDPVYTGKAMAGLIDLIRKGLFKKSDKVLFLHTGGSPALYHYSDYTL
ncbi:MAG TPA: D-cysteine desulfhydrase [Clostridiaceae bacterium]|jgi:D-cysteine desulfhydrase|nr:D-cysteine desulfhydrase [Clostridiaceae bacterium]